MLYVSLHLYLPQTKITTHYYNYKTCSQWMLLLRQLRVSVWLAPDLPWCVTRDIFDIRFVQWKRLDVKMLCFLMSKWLICCSNKIFDGFLKIHKLTVLTNDYILKYTTTTYILASLSLPTYEQIFCARIHSIAVASLFVIYHYHIKFFSLEGDSLLILPVFSYGCGMQKFHLNFIYII